MALADINDETRRVLMNMLYEGEHPLMRQRSSLYDLGELVASLETVPSAPFDLALKLLDEVAAAFTCDKCLCKLLFFGAAIAKIAGRSDRAEEYKTRAWNLKGIKGATPQEILDEVSSYIKVARSRGRKKSIIKGYL